MEWMEIIAVIAVFLLLGATLNKMHDENSKDD